MNATSELALRKLQDHHEKIVAGEATVTPGAPQKFTRGFAPDDAIAQGDLLLVLTEQGVPRNYVKRKNGATKLVPGTNVGARHCVVNAATCDIYDPPGFSDTYDELLGPMIVAKKDTVVGHPTHGHVTILGGQTVNCVYQRVFEHEEQKARRQRD